MAWVLYEQAPTKKELAETQKVTARIKASTEATIPRQTKVYPLSELFTKIQYVSFHSSCDLST